MPRAMTIPANETAVVPPEEAIRQRYRTGAREAEAALCCPVPYDPRDLQAKGTGDESAWRP
jgi:hypothetical protein